MKIFLLGLHGDGSLHDRGLGLGVRKGVYPCQSYIQALEPGTPLLVRYWQHRGLPDVVSQWNFLTVISKKSWCAPTINVLVRRYYMCIQAAD